MHRRNECYKAFGPYKLLITVGIEVSTPVSRKRAAVHLKARRAAARRAAKKKMSAFEELHAECDRLEQEHKTRLDELAAAQENFPSGF